MSWDEVVMMNDWWAYTKSLTKNGCDSGDATIILETCWPLGFKNSVQLIAGTVQGTVTEWEEQSLTIPNNFLSKFYRLDIAIPFVFAPQFASVIRFLASGCWKLVIVIVPIASCLQVGKSMQFRNTYRRRWCNSKWKLEILLDVSMHFDPLVELSDVILHTYQLPKKRSPVAYRRSKCPSGRSKVDTYRCPFWYKLFRVQVLGKNALSLVQTVLN